MRWGRLVRNALLALAAVAFIAAVGGLGIWIYFHPAARIERGVVYGRRLGRELTLDVFQPEHPNGAGIVVMGSGSWRSKAGSFDPLLAAPFLRRGYTAFVVYHISQPEASVMEIAEEVNRGVRYVRHNAGRYGVDPHRLGVTGGSSGGHLSLMLATLGGAGPANAPDEVDRESSAVEAVAIFYPVTDLLNLGASTENPGDGGPPKSFVQAFGPNATNLTVWKGIGRALSPIYHVTTNLPPTYIVHGDADTLVPVDQSQRFQAEARKLGVTVELSVHHGGRHGWPTMLLDLFTFADWFDKYLAEPKP